MVTALVTWSGRTSSLRSKICRDLALGGSTTALKYSEYPRQNILRIFQRLRAEREGRPLAQVGPQVPRPPPSLPWSGLREVQLSNPTSFCSPTKNYANNNQTDRNKVRQRGSGAESRSRTVYAKLERSSKPERARICQRVAV